jgi:hypothetical protein
MSNEQEPTGADQIFGPGKYKLAPQPSHTKPLEPWKTDERVEARLKRQKEARAEREKAARASRPSRPENPKPKRAETQAEYAAQLQGWRNHPRARHENGRLVQGDQPKPKPPVFDRIIEGHGDTDELRAKIGEINGSGPRQAIREGSEEVGNVVTVRWGHVSDNELDGRTTLRWVLPHYTTNQNALRNQRLVGDLLHLGSANKLKDLGRPSSPPPAADRSAKAVCRWHRSLPKRRHTPAYCVVEGVPRFGGGYCAISSWWRGGPNNSQAPAHARHAPAGTEFKPA